MEITYRTTSPTETTFTTTNASLTLDTGSVAVSDTNCLKSTTTPTVGKIPIATGTTRELGWKAFESTETTYKYKLMLGSNAVGWYSGNYIYLYSDETYTNCFVNIEEDIDGKFNIKSYVDDSRVLAINTSNNYAAFYSSVTSGGWQVIDFTTGTEIENISDIVADINYCIYTCYNGVYYALKPITTTTDVNKQRLVITSYSTLSALKTAALDNPDFKWVFKKIATTTQKDIYAKAEDIAVFAGDGDNSAVIGNGTATGKNSLAVGTNSYANAEGQLVVGRFNELDSNKLFIVGSGSKSNRNNVLTCDAAGNLRVSTNVYAGNLSLNGLNTKVDGIWYGDTETELYNYYPVAFADNTCTINRSNIFTTAGTYRVKVGNVYNCTATITQQDIEDADFDIGQINITLANSKTYLTCTLTNGNYAVMIYKITTTKIPVKYLTLDNYATKTYVDNAISNAIGGSY